jgi:LPXTG-motif cell wall-anchored protein
MTSRERPRLPPGRPPWEPINGVRIGGIVGVLVGGIVTALGDISNPWFIVGGATIGGGVGYWVTKRKMTI